MLIAPTLVPHRMSTRGGAPRKRVSNTDLLVSAPDDNLAVVMLTTEGLPESTIREEYRHSGMPRAEIAAAAAAPVR